MTIGQRRELLEIFRQLILLLNDEQCERIACVLREAVDQQLSEMRR